MKRARTETQRALVCLRQIGYEVCKVKHYKMFSPRHRRLCLV